MPQTISNQNASDDLGGKISLFSIARESRRIPWAKWTLPLITAAWIFPTLALYLSSGETALILTLARDLVRISVNSTIALLGFFLSGFAIFATLSDKALLLEMAKTPNAKYGISYFKYNFYVLLRPLLSLILLALLLLLALLVLGPGTGLGTQLITRRMDKTLRILVCGAIGFDAASFTFLVMSAGSFVANVYISVATSIRWELLKISAKKMPYTPLHLRVGRRRTRKSRLT